MARYTQTFSINPLKKSQVRDLINYLEETYGCNLEELKSYYFYLTGRGKVYLSTLRVDDLELDRVNGVGLYFGTFHDDERFRLSIEGSRLINPKKNYAVLKDEFLKSYLAAENLFEEELEKVSYEGGDFLIVQIGENNLGCVSKKEKEFLSYVPKSRKLDYDKVF